MAGEAGLCLAWSETPEDTFCRVVAHLLLHTYVPENFSSRECKVNLLICIFAGWVAASAFHSAVTAYLN